MATELGKAYVQIVPSAKGISGSITNVLKGESASAGVSAGNSIAGNIKGIIAKAGIGIAVTKSIKDALDAGGALQQSFGGLDTIYGEAADSMKEMSKEAVAAGINANTYAEQAVAFGASLKQAYGGDMVAAAKAADTAILDMADNSAKMGTDIQSIQNAYQGFAKQNYTMLDNLKLGYGGTKTEMERLLADAEKLTGVKYDINNLGDVYSAIHAIQENLGLTGVAAGEAQTTFTGSMQAMKAAATNLLADLSLGNDITKDFEVLAGNTRTFLTNNLLPMVLNIVKSLPSLIKTAGGELFNAGMDIIHSLTEGIQANLPSIIENGMNSLMSFSETLRENAGTMIEAGLNLILTLAQGLIDGLPTFIETIPTIISNLAGIINDNMPMVIETGINIIIALVKGIIAAIPVLIENLPLIIKAIWDVFTAVNWINIGTSLISDIANGIRGLFSLIPDLLASILNQAFVAIGNIDWLALGKNIITFIVNGVNAYVNFVPNALKAIATMAFDAFKNVDWLSLGSNIINGIVKGLKDGISTIINTAKEVAQSALDAAKDALGIQSPSRVFRNEVGRQISAGIAVGIDENLGMITGAMNKASALASNQFNMTVDTRNDEVLDLLAEYLPLCAENKVLADSSFVEGINQRLGFGVI